MNTITEYKNWRNHSNHRTESNAVKKVLIDAGYKNVQVRHGTGSAYSWLEIYCDQKDNQSWQEKRVDVLSIAKSVTGRSGEYDGEISVY